MRKKYRRLEQKINQLKENIIFYELILLVTYIFAASELVEYFRTAQVTAMNPMNYVLSSRRT